MTLVFVYCIINTKVHMKKIFNINNLLTAILVGLTVAATTFAFIGPSASPPNGNPYFWQLSGGNLYYTGGNVGIGTTNIGRVLTAGRVLDILSPAGTDSYVRIIGGQGATKSGLILANDDYGDIASGSASPRGTINYGKFIFDNGANTFSVSQGYSSGYLGLGANNRINDMVILASNGNVGIGTTTPTYKLTVSGGDIYASGYVRGATGLCIGSTCQTSWPSGGAGTVTSVGSGAGLTGGPITTSGTLSLNTAAVSNCTDSYNSKIIWDSTNNRLTCATDQNSGGTITGSGSTNYVSKFTNYYNIGSSIIYDNGTNVGIGTASPGAKLDVNGNINVGGGTITGLSGIGGAGNVSTGWYSDSTNLAARFPSGDFYVQSSGGGTTYLRSGAIFGGTQIATGDLTVSNGGIVTGSTSNGLRMDSISIKTTYSNLRISAGSGSYFNILPNGVNISDWTGGISASINDSGLIYSSYRIGIGVTGPTYQLQLSQDSAAKPGTNTWTVASDERLKTDVRPFSDGLDTILGINPVWYKYNGKGGFPADGKDNIGVIAQDIQKVAPYTVSTFYSKLNPTDATNTELLNFNSGDLTFVTINAIKELNNKDYEQQKQIDNQQKQINSLIQEIQQLKK
jgi:hypothetical protein